MTRVAKRIILRSIDQELVALRPEDYRSPIARLRVQRIIRRRDKGWPTAGEARELAFARVEEAAFARLGEP